MSFNFLSLNVNGLNDHLKRTALVDWLKCVKVDIVCLQETHAPSHESIRKWFANTGFRVVSSCHTSKSCGTALLIKDSLKVSKIITDDQLWGRSTKFCIVVCSEPEPGTQQLLHFLNGVH